MNLLEKNVSEFTLDEFFVFLSMKKDEIVAIRKSFLNGLSLYEKCCKKEVYTDPYTKAKKTKFLCYQNKIEQMLSSEKSKETLKLILMHVLGENFFELSDEEDKKNEELGFFTKRSIDKLFEDCISNYYGKPIVSPKSWDDMINNISNLIGIINDPNIPNNVKEKYLTSLNRIETLIANKYARMMGRLDEQTYAINTIGTIVKNVKAGKPIDIKDHEDEFKKILNKNILIETTHDDGTVSYEEADYGDVTIDCINRYNKNLDNINNGKKIDKKASKYYKLIKKTPVDKLEKDMFPSYSDEDIVELYRNIFERFNKTMENNPKLFDELATKLAISQMEYAGYFTSKYYDEEKVFGNTK